MTQVQPEQTILEVKNLLFNKINIGVNQQRLMLRGKALAGKLFCISIRLVIYIYII